MKILKLESLLENAIQLKNVEYVIDFVDCYLKNKSGVVSFNMIDIQLHDMWKNKEKWLFTVKDNSDINKRLQEMFDKLDIYFW